MNRLIIKADKVIVLEAQYKDHQIDELIIENGVEKIMYSAFKNNRITEVIIPDSVQQIGASAFDDSVKITYKGHVYNEEFNKKFGIENIIRASQMVIACPEVNFSTMEKSVFKALPIDCESIKSYQRNYKRFEQLLAKFSFITTDTMKVELFKLSFLVGLYNLPDNVVPELFSFFIYFYEKYTKEEITDFLYNLKMTKYYYKYSKFVLSNYLNEKFITVAKTYYENYNEFNYRIKKLKENEITKLNTEVLKKKEEDLRDNDDLKMLNIFKSRLKIVSIEDLINYIENHIFLTRNSCKELDLIKLKLSMYINKSEFEKIEDFYEKVKNVNYFSSFTSFEENKKGIHFEWLNHKDPINLLLGYLCDCCTKYGGIGEDIMLQSMINPSIKNLIVYDEDNNIIGKSTAYYNEENGYIIFNSISVNNYYLYKRADKLDEVYDAFLEGIYQQVALMRQSGYQVNDVRIGLKNNDLTEVIGQRKIDITTQNMLPNYRYNDYKGDANDPGEGQVIIDISNAKKRK